MPFIHRGSGRAGCFLSFHFQQGFILDAHFLTSFRCLYVRAFMWLFLFVQFIFELQPHQPSLYRQFLLNHPGHPLITTDQIHFLRINPVEPHH